MKWEMQIERVNLQKKLEKLQRGARKQEELLEEVRLILQGENISANVLQRITASETDEATENIFRFDLLETERIFHISQIQKLCIQYRLRFLGTRYFKGEIPPEALTAVRRLEAQHETEMAGFKIMAPAAYFRLENADDPMLFAPIGNGYYYLLHKWGTDMHPLRKLMVWPLRNLENIIIFSFFASFFLTFGVREIFFQRFQETSQFIVLFMYTFKSFVALTFFYGISLGKNFSSGNWNSKFYNA
ncbi:hypothetical protein [Salinimicrobium oceani]|uniref:Uncharacterized protein n=1 Tax=Salinimicrobium oceani TaxID=2722702 RepID=A0ABX1CSZ3_9FLAO|nr:hypothetical protein [Salinimicrobium oceani]NJW51423.1 hypothetical protein [Salinimicrobium oceani]